MAQDPEGRPEGSAEPPKESPPAKPQAEGPEAGSGSGAAASPSPAASPVEAPKAPVAAQPPAEGPAASSPTAADVSSAPNASAEPPKDAALPTQAAPAKPQGPGDSPAGEAKRAPSPKLVKHRPRGIMVAPPKPDSAWVRMLGKKWVVVLLGVAMCVMVLLAFYILLVFGMASTPEPPKLGEVYTSEKDDFKIKTPLNWNLTDKDERASLIATAPIARDYTPTIIVFLEISPKKLDGYIQDHKARMEKEDATLSWLGESETQIDGATAKCLEYAFDCEEAAKDPVKVYCRQYVVDSQPRYYLITFSVSDKYKDKYLPAFEDCARTFKRLPWQVNFPKRLPK